MGAFKFREKFPNRSNKRKDVVVLSRLWEREKSTRDVPSISKDSSEPTSVFLYDDRDICSATATGSQRSISVRERAAFHECP